MASGRCRGDDFGDIEGGDGIGRVREIEHRFGDRRVRQAVEEMGAFRRSNFETA